MNERKTATTKALLAALAMSVLLSACGTEDTRTAANGETVPGTGGTTGPSGTTPGTAPDAIAGNNPPTISGTPSDATLTDAPYSFQPSASDADGDPLTFSAQGLPGWLTLDASTGLLSGTPAQADIGETGQITLSVTDGLQTASLPPFTIQIGGAALAARRIPGTAAPVISGSPVTAIVAGKAWSFTPTATDADSTSLVFSITNKPTWASFSKATGTLSGTPALTNVGTSGNIVISVSDGAHDVSLPAFALTVTKPANLPPTLSGKPATTVTVGTGYTFTPTASDPEKQSLGFSIANKPAWATFNTATGALSGTPTAANVGTTSNIVISVSDGTNSVSLGAFSIAVQAAPNGAPVIGGTPLSSGAVNVAYSFTPTASDPNGDPLTFSISGKPSWASFNSATGALTGTPNAAGTYGGISISVSDGKTSTTLPAFSILVSAAVTRSANLSWTPPTTNTDGSSLSNLAGYWIYYGTDPSSLSQKIQVTNPGLTSYTVAGLASGKYYFAISAYTSDGVEGTMSSVGSKTL